MFFVSENFCLVGVNWEFCLMLTSIGLVGVISSFCSLSSSADSCILVVSLLLNNDCFESSCLKIKTKRIAAEPDLMHVSVDIHCMQSQCTYIFLISII